MMLAMGLVMMLTTTVGVWVPTPAYRVRVSGALVALERSDDEERQKWVALCVVETREQMSDGFFGSRDPLAKLLP